MTAPNGLRHRSAYPSRVADRPAMLERTDPVVWGAQVGAGPLASDEIVRYARDGFLTVDDLLSQPEVDRLVRETDDLLTGLDPSDERIVREPGSDEIRSVFAVHDVSPVFEALLHSSPLVERARQILGGDVYIHQSRVNRKPGFHGKEFAWHSDFETWHTEDGMPRMRALSLSLALTDNRPDNGSLMIIAGSHRQFVSCVGPTPEDHYQRSLRSQVAGVPDDESIARLADQGGIATCLGRAGSATMFDANCMHGSNSNITPFGRTNIFVVYNSIENALVEPFAAPQPRPTFLAERDARPIARPGSAATGADR